MSETAILHVCVTCRQGREPVPGQPVAGQVMFDAVAAEAADGPVQLRPVSCLAACAQGCAAALTGPGKWGYLLGRLGPRQAADLLAYAATYAASKTGTVMPSRRPASLADIVLGRIPILETP